LSFVIQKHAATRLHYDFRLELNGVLKSWAVPKGPSLNPSDKHLAVEVEDHPLEYAKFEGIIPEGEYGGGEVIIWDRGHWTPNDDPHQGLKKGRLTFSLDGEKLHGEWSLVRTHSADSNKPQWLLFKRTDEFAKSGYDITAVQPQSVKSGRLVEDLQGDTSSVWSSNRTEAKAAKATSTKVKRVTKKAAAKPVKKKAATKTAKRTTKTARSTARSVRASKTPKPDDVAGAHRAKLPDFVPPQLATLVSSPPEGDNWVHEIKFDGYRLLAHLDHGRVKLLTRTQQDWTHKYRPIVERLAELPVDAALLDGELVALLPSGVSSFQALQNAGKSGAEMHLAYYAFDLLHLSGFDLRKATLAERKRLLAELLPPGDELLRFSEHFTTDSRTFLAHCCKLGLEGMISKRLDRPYLSGRTSDWVKSKCLGLEELVVGGFTLSEKLPKGFGALLMGYYEGDELVYAGRVGTGFTTQFMADLRERLEKLKVDKSTFPSIPRSEVDRTVRWVKPQLVAQVQFTEWTGDRVMRHPSFQGLREDKPAKQVTRPASLTLAEKTKGEAMAPRKSAKKPTATARPRTKKAKAKPAPSLPSELAVKLTHPERVLFPDNGFTKLGLATYYAQVARWMLPHVAERPLSIVRCPEGEEGECFFQKHAGIGTPKELGRVKIQEKRGLGEYLYIRDLPGLVSMAQVSALEVHIWGSRCDRVEKPDRMIFDLDPDPTVPWSRVVAAAEKIRDVLAERDLVSFVKTTGGKGLHVVVPISPRRHDWAAVKGYSKQLAEQLAADDPAGFTTNMSKAARPNKIFVDYLRNDSGATAIAPYSTRARPSATVSMPVAWDELATIRSDTFTVFNALERLQSQKSDPWDGIAEVQQTLKV
jgi:bifunctional non-homologous end joining protein LigD